MDNTINVEHVDKGSRGHIFAETMLKSRWPVRNHMAVEVWNAGLAAVAMSHKVGRVDDPEFVAGYAKEVNADFAIVGPEEPLAKGVADRLASVGVPCVGPRQALAQLETSKAFTRQLLTEYGIPGNPKYRVFTDDTGVASYLEQLGEYVVKPDGLTGGKGVRVSGDHLSTVADGLAYCRELLAAGGQVVVEEKLIGEEFTFQSFCDGWTCRDMIPVQDHKRLLDGDKGPNTGGMGSYSCEDHLLPFLTREDVAQASRINQAVADALRNKTGLPYKGILYGSFIVTAEGLRVIEYNARFGDPEVMNVLTILETDFVDICRAIIDGTLDKLPVTFAKRATVCKYVVPQGYPAQPVKRATIDVPPIDNRSDSLRMYYGAVSTRADGALELTGSRALAFVGIGATLAEAERHAQAGARGVQGPVFYRRDIGTAALVQRRVDRMADLRRTSIAMRLVG